MRDDVVIIMTDDDEGHASLIKRNLKRAGISNQMVYFKDGQQVLDFLFRRGEGPHRLPDISYVALLDIRMPKVDGVEVLRQIKQDAELHKMPVTIVTTTDDPYEIEKCYRIGCNNYITKPINYDKFVDVIKELGHFLLAEEVPVINGG